MTTLIYDGSWQGLLTTVFELYERKLSDVKIETQQHYQPAMFSTAITVYTDEAKALRVWNGLKKYLSAETALQLYASFLSEISDIGQNLCRYMQLAFQRHASPQGDYANPDVLRVTQIGRMVHREKHRMEAFIRFQLTQDGLFYAGIEPDFNVIPLLLRHFKNRYADQRWLIYDIKRQYGIYYDLNTVEEIEINLSQKLSAHTEFDSQIFHADEMLYQTLWKDYFKHVNITERKNTRLHVQHVPKRYWKHLTEKHI
jgi:probable DNA metabolism protein